MGRRLRLYRNKAATYTEQYMVARGRAMRRLLLVCWYSWPSRERESLRARWLARTLVKSAPHRRPKARAWRGGGPSRSIGRRVETKGDETRCTRERPLARHRPPPCRLIFPNIALTTTASSTSSHRPSARTSLHARLPFTPTAAHSQTDYCLTLPLAHQPLPPDGPSLCDPPPATAGPRYPLSTSSLVCSPISDTLAAACPSLVSFPAACFAKHIPLPLRATWLSYPLQFPRPRCTSNTPV